MSRTVSEAAAKPYGVERVCEVWEQARSTFYDRQQRVQKLAQGIRPGKRSPKPSVSDAELLDLIRRDLAASPFRGEGHRQVWGRLHFGQGKDYECLASGCFGSCGRTDCCPLTVAYEGDPQAHDGTIITEVPNLMWGKDGTKAFTHDE